MEVRQQKLHHVTKCLLYGVILWYKKLSAPLALIIIFIAMIKKWGNTDKNK